MNSAKTYHVKVGIIGSSYGTWLHIKAENQEEACSIALMSRIGYEIKAVK